MNAVPRWQAMLTRHWYFAPPTALARLLQPLSWLYAEALRLRRVAYSLGLARTQRAPVPVIVVGNLVAGGSGKTPVVMHLVGLLRRHGYTPGVIVRGYGSQLDGARLVRHDSEPGTVGDEPLLVHLRTQAPVAVARRRIDAARALCAADAAVNVLVADDGLQHRALARDVEVIVFDERGLGNGLLLPAGPLRERPDPSPPPSGIVLYNASQASMHWPGHGSARRLAGAVALADWWQGQPPQMPALHALRGGRTLAVAGVAVPERFFALLRAEGLQFDSMALPDHHDYSALPWPAGTGNVIVTEKDAVKLRPDRVGSTKVWVAALDFVPEPGFDAAVIEALERATK